MSYRKYQIALTYDDRDIDGDDSNDFNVKLYRAVDNVVSVKLRKMVLPNLLFNVRSTNNALKLDSTTVTLDTGIYDEDRLKTDLKTKLDAVGAKSFTVSITDDKKVKIDEANSTAFTLDFDVSNSAYKLMGFDKGSTGSGTSHTGDRPYDISGDIVLYLQSDVLGKSIITNKGFRISEVIYINQNVGDIVFTDDSKTDLRELPAERLTPRTIQDIDLRFVDIDGNNVTLQTKNLHMVFELTTRN